MEHRVRKHCPLLQSSTVGRALVCDHVNCMVLGSAGGGGGGVLGSVHKKIKNGC